jgi:hypothetical protein
MKRCFQFSFLAIALLLRPATAAADSLTFTGLGSGSWVTIQYGSVTETGWAGEINWLLKTPSNAIGSAIVTYCADLFDDAKLPVQNVTSTSTNCLDQTIASGTSVSLGALPNAGAKAAYLVDTYAAGAHASNAAAAGLQIAIWQAMFGTGSFSYSAGAGVATAANGYYQGLLNAWTNNQSAVLSSTARYFDVSNDPSHYGAGAFGQDQIDPIVGSPEPATVFLMLFAIAAGVVYHYRVGRRRLIA